VCDVAENCTGGSSQCPVNGFLPATTVCRASAGVCDVAENCTGGTAECPLNGFVSEGAVCRGSAGQCDPSEACTGSGASCPSDVPFDGSLPGCTAAVCRTPGFWSTHAGEEKKGVNITQSVIQLGGGSLSICGQTIDSTQVGDEDSALEAMCTKPQADTRIQLARQLTALALNCVVSGDPAGAANCMGAPFESAFTACNAACTANTDAAQIAGCIPLVDCLNNGGTLLTDAGGFLCQTGTCSDNQAPCSAGDRSRCGAPTAACVPRPGCHDEPLPSPFEPPGPAGSSNSCNAARNNSCTIFNCP
jgi:hypothetical protein